MDDLEKRVVVLEKKLKNDSLFGSSSVGSSESDLVIKTKGKIKIQWGNKFIDLLKNGKINIDSKFIFKKDSVGPKDGIYIVDDKIYLCVNGESIPLISDEIGTTYVSFMDVQETDSDSKHIALTNIGFLYSDIDSISESSLKNGIVYIESEKKLYTITDGTLQEYNNTFKFPNPFPEQFVISKNDDQKGAIYIKGSNIENSLAFDKLYLYVKENKSIIRFDSELNINNNEEEKLTIKQNSSTFNTIVYGNKFYSINSDSDRGFRLYMLNGQSYLEVDNLKVRNSSDNYLFPEYWFLKTNIVTDSTSVSDSQYELEFTLSQTNEFEIGDQLYVYYTQINDDKLEDEEEEVEEVSVIKLRCEVLSINDNRITVKFDQEIQDEEVFINQFIYLIQSNDKLPLRLKSNTLDIVNCRNNEETISRIGDLSDLDLQIKDEEIVDTHGIYSNQLIVENAYYTLDKEISPDDNSTLIPHTKWIQNKMQELNKVIEQMQEQINNLQEQINLI